MRKDALPVLAASLLALCWLAVVPGRAGAG